MNKKSDLGNLVFIFFFIVFTWLHSWVNIQKFFIFHPSCFGMDMFGHMFWKMATEGRMVIHSIPSAIPTGIVIFFLAPIIYLYFFIYLLFPYPFSLLLSQSILIGSGSIPIFLLSKLKLKGNILPLAISFSYLLHPLIGIGAITGFVPQSTALVCFLWAFYFLEKGSLKRFLFFSILANFVKPHIIIVNIIFGFILINRSRFKKFGTALIKVSLFWLVISLSGVFVVLKLTGQKFIFNPVGLYKYNSLGELINVFISRPDIIISHLFYRGKYIFLLFCIFFPLGFLPLASPIYILPIIPLFFYLILFPESSAVFNIFAFVYLAFIESLNKFKSLRFRTVAISICVISLSLFSRYLIKPPFENPQFSGPLPLSKGFKFSYYEHNAHHLTGHQILKMIPAHSSCLASPVSLLGHLNECKRVGIFTVPKRDLEKEKWDYILVDFENLAYSGTDPKIVRGEIKGLLDRGVYEITESKDGWLLLKSLSANVLKNDFNSSFNLQ